MPLICADGGPPPLPFTSSTEEINHLGEGPQITAESNTTGSTSWAYQHQIFFEGTASRYPLQQQQQQMCPL